MTRPRRQSGLYGSTAALAAITWRLVDALPQVFDQGSHLLVRPASGNRGHLVAPVPDQLLERLGLGQQRVVRNPRGEVALTLKPVALRARALPLGAAQVV